MGERPGPNEDYDAPDSRRSFLKTFGAAIAGTAASTLAGCETKNEDAIYNELLNSPTEKMPVVTAEETLSKEHTDDPSTLIGLREKAGWSQEYQNEFRKILRTRNPEMISDTYAIKPGIYEGVPVNNKQIHRNFAKRQLTWLRGNSNVRWIGNSEEAEQKVREFLAK